MLARWAQLPADVILTTHVPAAQTILLHFRTKASKYKHV